MFASTSSQFPAPRSAAPRQVLRWVLFALLAAAGGSLRAAPAVATIYGAVWSPGDTARDGAAELEVLMCAASLRHANPLAGIVGVGRGCGSFSPAAEVALTRVALMGLPVVRVSQTTAVPAHDGDVFVEAGSLSPMDAQRVLAECLARYGSPPAAVDPMAPTKKELAAIQAKLALYQLQFNTHNASRLAMR